MDARDFIKQKVKECGSQSLVARKIGVSQPTINRFCVNASEPDVQTIRKIATAYGLPLSYFINDKQTTNLINIAATTPSPSVAIKINQSGTTTQPSYRPEDYARIATGELVNHEKTKILAEAIKLVREMLNGEKISEEKEAHMISVACNKLAQDKEHLRLLLGERKDIEHKVMLSEQQAIRDKEAAEKEETGEPPAGEQKRRQVVEPEVNRHTKNISSTTSK
jgi:transcriptional regulator with XRE-family HTH domain